MLWYGLTDCGGLEFGAECVCGGPAELELPHNLVQNRNLHCGWQIKVAVSCGPYNDRSGGYAEQMHE